MTPEGESHVATQPAAVSRRAPGAGRQWLTVSIRMSLWWMERTACVIGQGTQGWLAQSCIIHARTIPGAALDMNLKIHRTICCRQKRDPGHKKSTKWIFDFSVGGERRSTLFQSWEPVQIGTSPRLCRCHYVQAIWGYVSNSWSSLLQSYVSERSSNSCFDRLYRSKS